MTKRLCSLAALVLVLPSTALAADVKRECVEASTAGQTSRDAGELKSARDSFLTCSRDQCPSVVKSSCARWLSEVEAQLPSIVVRAADASDADITEGTATVDGVEVQLDGKPISLDPGKHLVVVETTGGVRLEKKVLLAAGEKSRLIELRVEAPKTEPERSEGPTKRAAASSGGIPTGAWLLGGAGVVALGSFGFFGLSAKSELNKLDSCSPSCSRSQSDSGRRDALIADISLGVGVVALAGAVTWAVLSSGPKDEASQNKTHWAVAPTPQGAAATVYGQF
jgi:hypothetical protein